jgi:hypothetical protein
LEEASFLSEDRGLGTISGMVGLDLSMVVELIGFVDIVGIWRIPDLVMGADSVVADGVGRGICAAVAEADILELI